MKATLFICTALIVIQLSACAQTTQEMKSNDLIEKIYTEKDVLPVELNLSDEEWKKRLTEDQYVILRTAGTERAFSGAYWNTKDAGTYYSAATGEALFRSDAKFDSGCGWPSFFAPLNKDAIIYRVDRAYGMNRIEILDKKSGSHLGHVFNDGPPPTGLRYCLNSGALIFVPDGGDPAQYGVPEMK